MAYQTCRVCGVRVPAGFTNCDGCYHKTDRRMKEEKFLRPVSDLRMPLGISLMKK